MRITAKTFSHLDLNADSEYVCKNLIASIVPREIAKSDLNAEWLRNRLHQFGTVTLIELYEGIRTLSNLNLDTLLFTKVPYCVDYSRNTALSIIEEIFKNNDYNRPIFVEFSRCDLVLQYRHRADDFDTSRILNMLKRDSDYIRKFDYLIDCAESYYEKPLEQIDMEYLDNLLCKNVANGSFKYYCNGPKDDVCEKYIALFDKLFPDLNLTPKHEQPILQRPF